MSFERTLQQIGILESGNQPKWLRRAYRSLQGMGYTAKNIKIHREKYNQMYDWELIGRLSDEYNKPIDWITRSIKACRLAGISPEHFINKYLKKENIDKNEDFMIAMEQILGE